MYHYFLVITLVILLLLLFFLGVNFFSKNKVTKEHKNRVENSKGINSKLGIRIAVCILFILLTIYQILQHEVNAIMWYYPVIVYSFLWNAFLLLASLRYKPYFIEEEDRKKLESFYSVVVIPVYNEDKEIFSQMLQSISEQTLLPSTVYIVEDGSKEENKVEEIALTWAAQMPFAVNYRYVENGGKRHAQSYAFREYGEKADVFVTMDSDTVLDKRAVEESLIPFLDEKVTSVAGLLLAKNTDKLLTKLLSVSFPTAFTNGRAGASRFNSVAVSCGGLATYRAGVIKKYLDDYLEQYIFGQKVSFGDDRMLTHYASLVGKTVYQETAIGYTLMPENLSHLTRQRIRWWKSFWWGGMFIVKHHQPKYMIWWFIVAQYISQILYAFVFPVILFINPIKNGEFPWVILLYMIFLGYIRSVRVMNVKNSEGEKYLSLWQYLIYTSFSTLLNIYLCTILSYYGFFMMWQVSGWGTRNDVEVGIQAEDELKETSHDMPALSEERIDPI